MPFPERGPSSISIEVMAGMCFAAFSMSVTTRQTVPDGAAISTAHSIGFMVASSRLVR
jgi:hypothetical protein